MNNFDSNKKSPRISVVIPVKNGAHTIQDCLDGIFEQTLINDLEVILIDSGSTDGTLDIANKYPLQIISIDPSSFNHGETRNLGVQKAKGMYVVFTVQDARPSDNKWLERMLQHFDNPSVTAVCGQQIVEHKLDKNPLQWFRPASAAEVTSLYFENFSALEGKEKLKYCSWDNVNAMYHRSDLLDIPFQKVSFSEDALWAKDALSNKKTLIYDYNSRVYHYHHQSFKFYFRRIYITRYFSYHNFNYLSRGKILPVELAKIMYRLSRSPFDFRVKLKWFFYNVNLELAKSSVFILFWLLVKTKGSKGADKGLQYFCRTVPQGKQNI